MGEVCCTRRLNHVSNKLERSDDIKNTFADLTNEQKLGIAQIFDEYYDRTEYEEELLYYYEPVNLVSRSGQKMTTLLVSNCALYFVDPKRFTKVGCRVPLGDILQVTSDETEKRVLIKSKSTGLNFQTELMREITVSIEKSIKIFEELN